jgi:membrane protease YdiL (CAAX protease family)
MHGADSNPEEFNSPPLPPQLPDASPCWTAKDAWKCTGMLGLFFVLFEVILHALVAASSGVEALMHTSSGFVLFTSLFGTVCTLTALYFARIETLEQFRRAFDLGNRPGERLWSGVLATSFLQIATWSLLNARLKASGIWQPGILEKLGVVQIALLAIPVLLAPFWEEIVWRGFLFRAFRSRYSFSITTAISVGFWILWHFDRSFRSWIYLATYALTAVILCWVRERSTSLWDCIACHFAFNGLALLLRL